MKNGNYEYKLLYSGQLSPIARLNDEDRVVEEYVYGSRVNVPEYMIKDGRKYRFITDHRGSVRMVVDTHTGEVVQETEYCEFGMIISETLAENWTPVLFGYAGGLQDRDTGLIRFGARWYDPEVGRWTSKEPLGFNGSSNFYVYAGNDPVNYVDVNGLKPMQCFKTMDPLIADIENYLINEAPMAMRQQAKLYEFLAEIIDGKSADGSVCYYYKTPYPNNPPLHNFVALKGANPDINNGLPERYIYAVWHSHVLYPGVFQGSEEFSPDDLILGAKVKGGIYMSYFMTDSETNKTWASSNIHYQK